MVVCGKAPQVQHETHPTLIVEVQSPSTRSIDRREKVVAYAQATSLQLVLLVDPNDRRIEAAYPEQGKVHHWTVFGPGELIVTEYGAIHVDALYDELDSLATT